MLYFVVQVISPAVSVSSSDVWVTEETYPSISTSFLHTFLVLHVLLHIVFSPVWDCSKERKKKKFRELSFTAFTEFYMFPVFVVAESPSLYSHFYHAWAKICITIACASVHSIGITDDDSLASTFGRFDWRRTRLCIDSVPYFLYNNWLKDRFFKWFLRWFDLSVLNRNQNAGEGIKMLCMCIFMWNHKIHLQYMCSLLS